MNFANVSVKCGQEKQISTRSATRNWLVTSDGGVKCVDEFLATICMFSRMDDLVRRFSSFYDSNEELRENIEIKNYTYHKLVLAYGPRKRFLATVEWRCQENCYHLALAAYDNEKSTSVDNPNGLSVHFLQNLLNETKDLTYLTKVLTETYSPLASLYRLPQLPLQISADSIPPPNLPYGHVFAVLPVNETTFRVFYRWVYCIEVVCLNDGLVAVRDANNCFTAGKDGKIAQGKHFTTRFSPILGLKVGILFFKLVFKFFLMIFNEI